MVFFTLEPFGFVSLPFILLRLFCFLEELIDFLVELYLESLPFEYLLFFVCLFYCFLRVSFPLTVLDILALSIFVIDFLGFSVFFVITFDRLAFESSPFAFSLSIYLL
jgi:hypothetical protein